MPVVANIRMDSGLDEWSDIININGTASSDASAGLAGSPKGMLITPSGTDSHSARGDLSFTRITGTDYRIRAYIDVSSLSPTDNAAMEMYYLLDGGLPCMQMLFKEYLGQWYMVTQTYDNTDSWQLAAPWHAFDGSTAYYWETHVFKGEGDGFIKTYKDGVLAGSKTELTNDSANSPDSLRAGLVWAPSLTTGSMALDEVVIRDDATEIGAYVAPSGSPLRFGPW